MNIPAFRYLVNNIPDANDRYITKFYYLTAARANEAAGKGTADQLRQLRKVRSGENKGELVEGIFHHTTPWCPRLEDVSYDSYEGHEILLIKLKVEKRREKENDNLIFRTVAIPLDYEPWGRDLTDKFATLSPKELLVPIYRQWLSKMYLRTGLRVFVMNDLGRRTMMLNPLRHLRISHLMGYYHLDPVQLVTYIGWSPHSQLKMPSEIDTYLSVRWPEYIQKLLKDLP